jgi:hypothetical protein
MKTCPDTGELRAALDGEADLDGHTAGCARCQGEMEELRRNAATAAAAIATLAPAGAPNSALVAHQRPTRSWAGPLAAAASLVLAVILVVTPGGRSAAAAFLSAFRTERLAVVTVDPAKAEQAFASLDRIGTMTGAPAEPRPVANLAGAAGITGIDAAQLDPSALPPGVQPTPQVQAVPASEVRLTLSRERAPDLPGNLDGSTLVIGLPAMVVQGYPAVDDTPGVVVAEAGQLTVDVEGGATLGEVRDYLLSRPELPPETVAQLRGLDNWETTLPIPVPLGDVAWRDTTIAGGPGLIFGDNSGLGSAAVWQRDGRIHGVAGALTAEEVTRLANSLR